MKTNYSWSDMANFMRDNGVPHSVMNNLADPFMTAILGRPVFNLINFDDFLHKNMASMKIRENQ